MLRMLDQYIVYPRCRWDRQHWLIIRFYCINDDVPISVLRRIYDNLYTTLVPSTIPAAVLIIAKYQYQIAFVADQEINMLACLTELMVECEFK